MLYIYTIQVEKIIYTKMIYTKIIYIIYKDQKLCKNNVKKCKNINLHLYLHLHLHLHL